MGRTVTGSPTQQIELKIGGMTCAACAARVERRLQKLDGVTAAVNLATERATVTYPAELTPEQLIEQVEKAGYTAALPEEQQSGDTDEQTRSLLLRLVVSAALAAPVIVLAMAPALQFPYWQWVSLALTTPVAFWGAWPFHCAAWANLRHATATMDTLISLGVLSAYLWSLYALVFGSAGTPGMRHSFSLFAQQAPGEAIYLEVASGVTAFILAGRYFERRSRRRAGAAMRALLELGAKDVAVLRDGVEQRVPVDELSAGDEFVVRPGEKIATDGVVVAGSSAIDTSILTGESVPVEVTSGDEVTGGTVNTSGRLVVRASRVGSDTKLAQMARLVEQAQSSKADVQRLADRVSAVFVPAVIALAAITLAGWLISGAEVNSAFTAAVAVLIIACPCALGLATPTALLVGTGRGAQLGILIKGPEVLESTRRVDTVVLDKTGTVTTGRMSLAGVQVARGVDKDELLRLAGAAEHASEHPIARAVAEASAEQVGELPAATSFHNFSGLGVQATVEGHSVLVGRPALLEEHDQPLPADLVEAQLAAEQNGQTVVAVAWDGRARGILAVSDSVKPTSAQAVARLRELGLHPVLLTGDNETVARAVAAEVGVQDVIAEALPDGKVEAIAQLQRDGKVVAMVGDGVNDAAALAQADLGLAVGTGADVAIEAADLALVRGDLNSAVDAIRLSRRTLGTIKGNLFWAFAYNVAALPLAAFGLLNPMIAGAAMAFSSVFVVTNSLRLRRFRSIARSS